ncbi:Rieske (2Fe-2S) protein [Gemmobacter sp. 24YEA27]|uniref:Rieske (2Fe-2S) protein n=1 Tax=Gemmobacter sp. 24YEA27 TaxID=3040672 RepID=UPI0024B3B63F|nr:Rieske (2Fe-2S) protein [Gemmobacter sp. 24YEA27]
MTRFRVGTTDCIAEGGRLKIEINGRPVVIFNVEGRFYALSDRCPHQGGPLSGGDQIGELRAERVGEHQYCRRNMTVRCPWHHWEFDIETGRSRIDPARLKVRSFETAVESGPDCDENEVPNATTYQTVADQGVLYVIM